MPEIPIIRGFEPVAVGVSKAPTAALMDRAQIDRVKISQAANLSDFADQYAFYHPGLMYCCVDLGYRDVGGQRQLRDPFRSFVEEYGYGELVPMCFKFARPLVEGFEELGHAGWNHVVYALEKPIFNLYKQWIGSVGFLDHNRKQLQRLRYQDFDVLDPLALDRMVVLRTDIPKIQLTVFALDTTAGRFYAFSRGHMLPLRIAFDQVVHEDTQKLADDITAGSDEPYAAIPLTTEGEDELRPQS